MDTKGINEKMIILFIVVAMLMSATCLDGENISSTKSNGKKTLTRSSLDRDSCTKYCMMTKCMPRYHNQKRCFDTCHFYCTEPLAHFIYRNVDSSVLDLNEELKPIANTRALYGDFEDPEISEQLRRSREQPVIRRDQRIRREHVENPKESYT
ncbi:hypothetical protein YC2023_114887 [Brassica napus]